jgi:nicotinate-nucleotide adenylyltransferase
VARVALAQLQLDELRWIPAGQPWQKSRHLTEAGHREAMVRLAIDGIDGFVLDRTELRRRGPSFTLDTVCELQAARAGATDEWVLILGQDQYAGLHTWRDWRELLRLVTLAVARRPDAPAAASPEVAAFAHLTIDAPMADTSSSDIRARVLAGLPIDGLVPPTVASYIESHGLYRTPPTDFSASVT